MHPSACAVDLPIILKILLLGKKVQLHTNAKQMMSVMIP